jgi:hypothetical protein
VTAIATALAALSATSTSVCWTSFCADASTAGGACSMPAACDGRNLSYLRQRGVECFGVDRD